MMLPTQIDFTHPMLLYLLVIVPLWAALVWPRSGRGVLFTRTTQSSAGERGGSGPLAAVVLATPRLLRGATIVLVILAVAGPERVDTVQEISIQGRGLALVVDLSSSMLARDMEGQTSRIDVAREAAVRFARDRLHDEVSVIGFGGEALTRVPPTRDPELVAAGVRSLEVQLVRDGTDISGAVLTAMERLLESEREPRVLVLLTDGAHNGVSLPPLAAGRAAAALGVRIHTIGIQSPSDSLRAPGATRRSGRAGETMGTVLSGLADLTGGRYFQATSGTALDSVYEEIGRTEVPEEVLVDTEERSPYRPGLFIAALALLGIELLMRGSRWGVVP